MPTQQTHLPIVRQWLQSLGVLTAVSISRQEAEMKLAAYVPALMREGFPDQAFTADSLNHVAKACRKGFPTYPELYLALREWWHEHRPPVLRLAGPAREAEEERPPATPEELERIRNIVKMVKGRLRAEYLEAEPHHAKPRYLTPEQLDRLRPLPNGIKRTDMRNENDAA